MNTNSSMNYINSNPKPLLPQPDPSLTLSPFNPKSFSYFQYFANKDLLLFGHQSFE